MVLDYACAFQDAGIAGHLVHRIAQAANNPIRIMEVCGTHTMALFRHGIRSLLPRTITMLSGPGCPVCVTEQTDIDRCIALARQKDVVVATFGDLMRVPGSTASLQMAKAAGADVRVVYSAMDAVNLARRQTGRIVAFLGIGFETTAPTVGGAILAAEQLDLPNFCVLSAHKTVPPALETLMAYPGTTIDGFLLPGHVSIISGVRAYRRWFGRCQIPSVVAGFEPIDLLQGILALVRQIQADAPALENAYGRAVTENGNTAAQEVLARVFEPVDARWRGMGTIANSGLAIRSAYARFDAARRFDLAVTPLPPTKGCICGDILTGVKTPRHCPLFGSTCTPATPVGPCMVSSEGTCAAYYSYHEQEGIRP
ncbi:MAG: hydrogenase formation protein HypD [Desulfatitalea sp.]|nr:hydrogenase formation protein HypD [Desulfatitalea sp.]NNK02041.1 hydrogenase formation protein HypD [Desulfatitalea sp.]